jgi:hypothetical protein
MELLFKKDTNTNTDADIEGMCLAPPDYAQRMVVLSQIALLTGIIGIAYGWTWCGIGVCIGSFISQLYWSNPTLFSWRRMLDIAWVQILIWTHVIAAWNSAIFLPYALIQLVGVGFFCMSWNWQTHDRVWEATVTHACVHLCANISLCILYLFG